MESEIENWTAKAEAWRRHADLSRKRAAIVRKVAGMMRGTEPLPDGLTRAALVVCGTAWRGFEWTRRGGEVSPAVWESEMAGAERTQAVLLRELAKQRERAARVVKGWEIAAAVSGAVLGNRPGLAEEEFCDKQIEQVLASVAGCLDALNEEGEAWRDFEAAYLEAREAVPVEEIEAARSRLAAEDVAATAPLRKGGGKKPPAAKSKGRKRYNISQKEAAIKLGKNVRTLQRYEANPGCVPDEMRGYCRAVRKSWADFNTWLAGLGMHEGTQSMLREAASNLGGNYRGMRVGRRP